MNESRPVFCMHFRPDLIDMEMVSQQSNQENLEQAFEIAESLGVTRLLDAEGETCTHHTFIDLWILINAGQSLVFSALHLIIYYFEPLFLTDVDVPSPDEKSVITYVSSIYDAFPKIPEGGEGIAVNVGLILRHPSHHFSSTCHFILWTLSQYK